MKKMQKFLALFLALSMLFSLLAVSASADGNLINKTAKWDEEGQPIADVTLSVPGDVKVEGADIVFVIDKSSCGKYATAQFKEMFQELAAAQAQSGADIKVGVVQFNYTDHVDIPLTKLTSDNVDELLAKIDSYSSGTNMESGLLTAKQMLDADTSVRAENKHVILISDGLTWAFDDAAGNPCTILYRTSEKDSAHAAIQGHRSTRPTCDSLNFADIAGYDTWDAYWAQIKVWVANDAGKYDYNISNYKEASFSDEMNSDAAKAVAPLTSQKDHATCFERAIYDAWLAYTDLQSAGYNCYINNVNESNDSVGYHFMTMLAGDQKAVDFESIKDTIIYSVAKGSYVEDIIGYGDDYNFDFLVDGKITLTIAGKKYTTTKLATAKEGFTASYAFTAPNANEATFWLDYAEGNKLDTEKFIWTFGEDVSAFYPAKLDYQVELVSIVNDPTETEAKVDTNKSATLYPKDTDGKEGTPEVFPVPQLTLPKYKVTYKYVGDYLPSNAPELPAVAYYFAGDPVTVESGSDYELANYKFVGWDDPCNALIGGIMPAHDVTLVGYYLPVNVNVDPPIGIKTDKESGKDLEYDVTVSVPGDGEAVKIHDEIILVLDGSYSVDEEWPKMKENIIEIGNKVLGGAGRTQMTIIAFGMGDNIFAEGIKTVDELKTKLDSMPLPGYLLFGRSSTNCEVGFTAALNYIKDKQDVLSNVDVIYISDFGVNTDETPDLFHFSKTPWTKTLGVAGSLVCALQAEIEMNQYYAEELKPSAAFTEVFGENVDLDELMAALNAIVLKKHAIYQLPQLIDEESELYAKVLAWANKVYTDVFEGFGLDINVKQPISVVERAFVTYDNTHSTYIQEAFYYPLIGRGYSDMYARTIKAAEDLADCNLVNELYLIRYGSHNRGWWAEEVEGAKYLTASSVTDLSTVITPLATELSNTNYTNVVITDYMSKWVNLDLNSIYIKNDTTGEIIWTIADGWKSETDRPTEKTPVTYEVVADNKYTADDGETVEINQNGVLYKLTWNVKDDCLLRTDNYSLHYKVTVDTKEPGFIAGKEYPANGHTFVEYEKDGKNIIDVPNVTTPAYTVTYLNGQIVLQKTEAHLTGDNIPTCVEPETYVLDGYSYTFSHWNLVSGAEGDDKTVGVTDLVYEAVFTSAPIETEDDEEEDDEIIEDEDVPLGPAPEDIPKTGDADLMVMIICAIASAALVALVLTKKSFFVTK